MPKEKITHICDRIIEICFYVLLIAVTFSTSIVEIAVSVMILAWTARKIFDRNLKFLGYVPVKVLIVFMLWTLLSCLNSNYPKESFRGVFKVAEYAVIFVIAATSLRREVTIKRSVFVIAAVATVTCANGIFQYFSGFDFIRHRHLVELDYLHRISSSFVHPNDFGVYLLVVSIIFMSLLFLRNGRMRGKLSLSGLFVLSMVSFFLTKSRGAWISFAAALLVLGALKTKRIFAIFVVILMAIFLILPFVARDRISDLADFKSGTTWERLMLWKGAINMIREHPFLGFGVNTYSRNFPKYKPPEYPDVRYSHNSYLQMASEVGIPGALLFLAFLLTTLIYSLKSVIRMPGSFRKDYAVGLFAGLVGFSLNCMVDTHLYSVNLAVFFYLLLGFCFALSCYAQEK